MYILLNAAVARIEKLMNEFEFTSSSTEDKHLSSTTAAPEGDGSSTSSINDFTRLKAEDAYRVAEEDPTELSRYLRSGVVPVEVDPLKWWEEKKYDFPRLYKVCIIVTNQ